MTRALVLYAHPCEESLGAALHRKVVETLESTGMFRQVRPLEFDVA